MMKKLLMSATLAAAALVSTQLLADQAGNHHGQRAQCEGTDCPATTTAEAHGQHGMGHGGMHGGRMEQQAKRMHGGYERHGAQRGNAGEDCPMHNQSRSS